MNVTMTLIIGNAKGAQDAMDKAEAKLAKRGQRVVTFEWAKRIGTPSGWRVKALVATR
jgi:hypothetical protein